MALKSFNKLMLENKKSSKSSLPKISGHENFIGELFQASKVEIILLFHFF